ncbi:aminotransferase class IV [Desulfosporosinus sp. Sb-LF]|uniref:aminotransferase class IV n=1 Tax=Desulfosporosinus sp. Sb-LF TaxID=2560027 RepID=UPI001FB11B99|nr:aminotransferase class IV [Desulfosporosinus sp. Sb-LF]
MALFGFGLFETLLITEKGPLFMDLHWQRMNKGANLLGLKLPDESSWSRQVLNFVNQITSQTPTTFPYALRVTFSGGAPETQLPSQFLLHKRLIPYTTVQYTLGIRLHLLPCPRNEQSPLVSIKSTNYVENILAKEAAKLNNADEGLWLNTQGFVCEGTMSNLFFIKDGVLFTPSLSSGCLPGTRRQLILELAQSLEIPTQEGLYPLSDLLSSEEIFMTNALMGVMPVRQINDFPFHIESLGSTKSRMQVLNLAYKNLMMKSFSSSNDFHV